MKMNFNRTIGGVLIALIGFVGFTSCSDDFPSNVESDKYTDLKSVKIVNAGAQGNEVLEGTIDEATKTITFPRLDTLTDFSAVKFEAVTSDGATLEKDVVNIPFQKGDTQRDVILKVVNSPRFKEYKAVIRFKVPVYGADFTKGTVYDYSSNPVGNPTYAGFGGGLTRGTGFDGKHVLVINRGNMGVHLLSVEDLKNNVTKPIPVNTTGVTGGTYPYNMGAQVNGRTYIASLSTAASSPLKLYYWEDPAAAPQVIANINVGSLAGAGTRHGDNFSIGLDNNGNGYAYFISMGTQIIRLKIEAYKNVTETSVINTAVVYGQWSYYNRIGNSDNYLVTGHDKVVGIANNGGGVSYNMAASSIPVHAGDPRVIEFNGERYLLVVTVPRGGNANDCKMYVYNITKGANIVDAITAFEQSDNKKPIYEFSISGNTTTAPGTQSGYHIVKNAQGKDEKLMIYGASADFGFTIVEFPVNVLED